MSGEASGELEIVAAQAAACVACALHETRTTVVFGVGSPTADVFLVGEGPGFHEDQQGEPFVGRSGELLDQLLGEIGLSRPEVYIGNVVKCRPPGNRDPRPDEIEACKGYLRRQLELIQPRVVVTLGNFASKLLLRTEVGITRLRGHSYDWWGRQLVPTFHPAAALRGGDRVLTDIRFDFGLVRQLIDAPPGVAGPAADDAETPPADPPGPEVPARQLGLFA